MTTWDYDLAVGDVDLANHTGLLLAEDDALKTYLSGLTVPDGNGGSTEVGVWFRFPEGERRKQFPFITIDWLGIQADTSRWTSIYDVYEDDCRYLDPETGLETGNRGMYIPSTSPTLPELSDPENMGYDIQPYLMHTLTYQVSVYSRSIFHDRFLTSRFMTDVFPPAPFFLPVDADMTYRRCQLAGMQQADTTETAESGNKRVFRKVYTLLIDAEIPYSKIVEIGKVTRIHADLYTLPVDPDPETPPPDEEIPVEPVDHDYDDEHDVADDRFTIFNVEVPSGS